MVCACEAQGAVPLGHIVWRKHSTKHLLQLSSVASLSLVEINTTARGRVLFIMHLDSAEEYILTYSDQQLS